MRKILELEIIERTWDYLDASKFPHPGVFQLTNPDPNEYRQTLPNNLPSEGNAYFIFSTQPGALIICIPIEFVRQLPDAPEPLSPTSEHRRYMDGAELQPGAMVVPQGSGFVSEAGLIEICRALAHCPPKPAP